MKLAPGKRIIQRSCVLDFCLPRRRERGKGFGPDWIFLLPAESFAQAETSKHRQPHLKGIYRCLRSSSAIVSNLKRSRKIQHLIEAVFRELHAKSPNGVRYLVLKLSDGTFCHLFEDSTKTIANLDAFAAFRRGGEDRRLDEPQQFEATIVGNYRMLTDV